MLPLPTCITNGNLQEGQAKMSKSDPDSAIFMEDTPEDVVRKIKQAYCPSKAKADKPQVCLTASS